MKIEGHVALVTGGSSGLGRAVTRRLNQEGARVVIADLCPPRDSLADEPGSCFVECDVTDTAQVDAALDLAQTLGEMRIAINCAGINGASRTFGPRGPFPLDLFKRVIEVNLVGTFNVTRLAAQRIAALSECEGERGVIINTSSIAAFDGQVGQAAYSASKSAIAGMTLPVARDLARYKIRVVALAPGPFATAMYEALPSELAASLESQMLHPTKLGDPNEFANLVCHVASNSMLNAETIRVDAGTRMGVR